MFACISSRATHVHQPMNQTKNRTHYLNISVNCNGCVIEKHLITTNNAVKNLVLGRS